MRICDRCKREEPRYKVTVTAGSQASGSGWEADACEDCAAALRAYTRGVKVGDEKPTEVEGVEGVE